MVHQSIALNPAQLRNLRNWTVDELPRHTLTFVLDLPGGTEVAQVVDAVRDLGLAHEGLRSRLAGSAPGEQVQEVLTEASWVAVVPGLVQVVADGEVSRDTILVPPREAAVRAVLYLHAGRPTALKVSISHVFADGLGRQAVARHLVQLLAGAAGPEYAEPRQASDFAKGPTHPDIVRSTDYWKEVHADAPRACVFAAMRREPEELADGAQVSLTAGESAAFEESCRTIGAGVHAAWIAVLSTVVGALSANHHQVFKTTMANRLRRADLSAVAQLAQPVFPVLAGSADDTVLVRVTKAERSLAPATRHGMYDANELLDWVNRGAGLRGVLLQPAFELNFLPPAPRSEAEALYGQPVEQSFSERAHLDPFAAKPELVLTIRHFPQPSLRVVVRRSISAQVSARAVAGYCRAVVGALSTRPDTPVAGLDIPRLPGIDGLLRHVSGAGADLSMTRSLLLAAGGSDCEVRAVPVDSGAVEVHARVRATDARTVRQRALELLPWFGGAVLPDELLVV